MKTNWKVIVSFWGALLGLNGVFMLLAIIPGILASDEHGWKALLVSGFASMVLGSFFFFFTKDHNKTIGKREGYLIVGLGWIWLSLSGCLPYILSGTIPSFAGALFETISGYTTTGASVLSDIEAVSPSILTWRSMTHWIGGMGIIVLTVAILPILGIGGMQLFSAEAPGVTTDKLHPRITDTAKRLWFIYVGLTFVETIFLWLAGMTWFDAFNHSMSTISTGGFSTKNDSIAAFDSPWIHYIIIFFMFMSGINFALTYWGIKGKLDKIYKNEEFRFYLGVTLFTTLLVTLVLMQNGTSGWGLELAFRNSLFQVISFITTTGFVSADLTNVSGAFILKVIFFFLLFLGGSAGSTAGGIKIVRHLVIFKNSWLEFKRLLHPSGIIPVRYNDSSVHGRITFNVMAFIIIYLLIFGFGSMVMAFTGLDFESAIGAAATSLGNVGPSIGSVCPVCNFGHITFFGKIFLSFLMLIGRLEIFTVLILFTPFFWKRN
ncbi:MAG: TrkH family potassium uptake protein [Chitinophagales bacterium]|nr:TrkH family potassium uptake protein [Chitinophagales bacterium]